MNTFRLQYILLIVIILLTGCGKSDVVEENIYLSGSVDMSGAVVADGPVFLLVSRTDDFRAIESDPMNMVASMVTVPDEGSFNVSLADLNVKQGEKIYLIAFVDNDYKGGIPLPTAGDYLGFYINKDTWQTAFIAGNSDELLISINREVYDFSATVRGTVQSDEPGDLILVAYGGDINSFDVNALNIDDIIGFKRILKPEGALSYSLDIMPYGKDVPVEGVYLIALLDRNGNGMPDGGDGLGFYVGDDPMGLPKRITIEEGVVSDADISIVTEIPVPSGENIRLQGAFTSPEGYSGSDKPVYILVAKTDDPNAIFTDPLAVLKTFQRLDGGVNSFDIDLSKTDLKAGDDVMVLALWDLDFEGGLPSPTENDKAGFFMNSIVDNYCFTATLESPVTTLETGSDWEFKINRILYDYSSEVEFTMDTLQPNRETYGVEDGAGLIGVIVHEDGVNLMGQITDIKYVIAMKEFSYNSEAGHIYKMPLLRAIHEDIKDVAKMNSYLVVLHDKNEDGKPTQDVDHLAAFWKKGETDLGLAIIETWQPDVITIDTEKEINTLERTVKFFGKKYGEWPLVLYTRWK